MLVGQAPQPIDVSQPYSDGWWLKRLYDQLRLQQRRCELLQARYEGNPPLPFVSEIQREAVRWFVKKSRTNFERLIVNAVLSRLRIVGLRTALGDGEGGDAEATAMWNAARMKIVVHDINKMMLAMSQAYAIVGKDDDGELLVTAEDPRLVTVMTDPANPYKVLAGLKLFHDDVAEEDVAYLYLPGRLMVAKKPRKRYASSIGDVRFNPRVFFWDEDIVDSLGAIITPGASGPINDLVTKWNDSQVVDGLVPVVPYVNEDGLAEFEPHIEVLDRINQQILQRMTIATIQAFKQRAFKGLPQNDPTTGEKINYDEIFVADPGAIWNIPDGVDIWESGTVDLSPILQAIRDDVKDLAATSGTPLYSITPDAANGSAEGASLQRETLEFKSEAKQDRTDPSHRLTARLMFLTAGDKDRADPKKIEVIWAPVQKLSMTERANAIAQTRGVLSRYQQATEIWGMTPAQADRNMTELTDDFAMDQEFGITSATRGSGATGGAPIVDVNKPAKELAASVTAHDGNQP